VTRAERIAGWLQAQCASAGARGFVVGLSGGVDSAVVACLCQMAAPQHALGVILPCYSHSDDEAYARQLARAIGIPVVRVDLDSTFDALSAALVEATKGLTPQPGAIDIKQQLPDANIKPRLRMTALYYIANSLNYLVAGTGNLSELTLGYYTKHGDGGVDLLPIGGLLKSEVRTLARELGVPGPIVDRPPSAGLWMGQTDEAEMGFTYDALEQYLREGPGAVDAQTAARIDRLRRASDHKRALPPVGPV
jgi:NAD+ synthase